MKIAEPLEHRICHGQDDCLTIFCGIAFIRLALSTAPYSMAINAICERACPQHGCKQGGPFPGIPQGVRKAFWGWEIFFSGPPEEISAGCHFHKISLRHACQRSGNPHLQWQMKLFQGMQAVCIRARRADDMSHACLRACSET